MGDTINDRAATSDFAEYQEEKPEHEEKKASVELPGPDYEEEPDAAILLNQESGAGCTESKAGSAAKSDNPWDKYGKQQKSRHDLFNKPLIDEDDEIKVPERVIRSKAKRAPEMKPDLVSPSKASS